MGLAQTKESINYEEYIDQEATSDIKHELIDGELYAMTGATRSHVKITGNISRHIGNHLDGTSCIPYASDMNVKVSSIDNGYYPDVVVSCEEGGDERFLSSPKLIIEVSSKSTAVKDRNTKLRDYFLIPSLQEYALIEQDRYEVSVYRRYKDRPELEIYYEEDKKIEFTSIGLRISMKDLYKNVF